MVHTVQMKEQNCHCEDAHETAAIMNVVWKEEKKQERQQGRKALV